MIKSIFLTSLCLFLSGCATKPVNYYFGNYSRTLYHSKKANTPEALAAHRNSLEKIIKKSEEEGIRVPPGIYCEYAYLLAKSGEAGADRYFALEVATYPESAKFVAFVREQMKSTGQ